MISIRRADERGATKLGWLDSRHTFSFGAYQDPSNVRFRALRVINDDTVAGGAGFGEHGHDNMEIVSYVVDGTLAHEDSAGGRGIIGAGEVQRMTAGSGIRHAEFNASKDKPVRFLQIWIYPDRQGLEPGYEQRSFSPGERSGTLRELVTPDGDNGSLRIHQDVKILGTLLDQGESVRYELKGGRHAWVQVVRGSATLNAHDLRGGDGAAVSDERTLEIVSRATRGGQTELLVFDLA